MKKFLFLIVALAIGLCGFAQEFKAGNAKYIGNTDGTAKLVDFKKASGDVVIPEKVTNPKTKQEFTVSSIGKFAFEKSKVTSVVIPSTVTSIGAYAFDRCKQLSKVTLPKSLKELPDGLFEDCKSLKEINLEGVRSIGSYCFSGSGLTSVTLPSSLKSIGKEAFFGCGNLTALVIEEGASKLEIPNILYGVPLETLVVGRPFVYSGDKEKQNKPFNNNPALKKVTVLASATSSIPEDFVTGCTSLSEIIVNYDEPTQGLIKLLFLAAEKGGATINGKKCTHFETANIADAAECGLKWANRLKEIDKQLAECVDAFCDNVTTSEDLYLKKIKTSEKVRDIPRFKSFIKSFNDRYLKKGICPTKYSNHPRFIGHLFDEYLSYIIYDETYPIDNVEYNKVGAKLNTLAKEDILHQDDSNKKEDFLELLKWLDQFIEIYGDPNSSATNSSISYEMAIRLFVLCKLGRWKEAAAYFPKVHRAVTEDGYYALIPYEIDYMQNVINEHGYKAVTPKYKRGQSGSSQSGPTIESVTEGLIKGAVNRYEEKKAEKRRREMLYDTAPKRKKR